jgi:WD40 repeat protein
MDLVLRNTSSDLVQKDDLDQLPTNLQLTGHKAQVYSLDFHKDGNYLASAGFDR